MNPKTGITFLFVILLLAGMPEATHSQHLMSVIKSQGNLNSFAKALESSGLDSKLSGNGPLTIFAPTDEVFEKEISGKNLNSGSVRNLLLNHIMTGYGTERNMKVMSKATSLGGITLVMQSNGNTNKVNNYDIIEANIKAQNGILHIIDGVLK